MAESAEPAGPSPDRSLDSAHQWLEAASRQLGEDPTALRELTTDLLDLTRDVAHGPSRPAAPLTAFLIGLAAGRALEDEAESQHLVAVVRAHIRQITELLDSHPAAPRKPGS